MTTGIDTTAASSTLRHLHTIQSEVQSAALEAPAMHPEVLSRLLQFARLARTAGAAAARQMALSEEVKTVRLGTMGPPVSEALSDAVALEELKRKKQKESELASEMGRALQESNRSQFDLLRAFPFLMPQIVLEDENAVGLPGFQSPMQNPADMDTSGLVWNSHADFFAQISALLEVLKTEWLSKYQDSLAKFLEFYEEFADIMEQIKPEASGDKGDVVIDFNKVAHALKELREKYGLDVNAMASFSTRAEADAFVKSMGLPLVVTQSADGKFHVKINMSAVTDLIETMPHKPNDPGGTHPVKWDSAKYNAWVSSKDSNMEQIKHVSKVLGEKLNEMTQKFDNIVKILSSSIDKMSEANNAYVHNT
ncbi:type III secretion system IpaD/SipD/SspD family effector [Stenotrophomonas rhizophila]|uniref:IpaD/SipD/SspD family type III secretion system needle tip protein n=1 Tax=Stenotrophomonas rhizophila TaxID=216778 RepID=UPI003391207F